MFKEIKRFKLDFEALSKWRDSTRDDIPVNGFISFYKACGILEAANEYKKDHPKTPFAENVNLALNATLSRTINTSLTTLVTMLAIAIWGGEVIRGLAVALILGIIIGTYASIFIGTTVMYDATMSAEKHNKK